MSLQRLWQRQLAGASGVALFVPVTMIVMLGVLGLTGGFAGLGTLGQLISGPAAPSPLASVLRASARPAIHHRSSRRPLFASSGSGPRVIRPGAQAPAGPSTGVTVSPGPGRPSGPSSPAPRPATSRPAPRPGAGRPVPPPGSGAPAPGAAPTAVDVVVAAGAGVASQLPSPAGAAVGQVLRSVGSTADSLLKGG